MSCSICPSVSVIHLAYIYIVLHLSHWLHSRNSLCPILHAEAHSPQHIYGYLWPLTNRSGSGLVLHEAMPSALLRLSVFSCLQLNRNNRLRHCRRNRMSLCHIRSFIIYFCCLFLPFLLRHYLQIISVHYNYKGTH